MWEWRFFCDLEGVSSFFSDQEDLELAISSQVSEVRLDRYVNLETPKLGLKFRNIRKKTKKALLELKILIQTNSWRAEFWEKPIRRYTSIHPAKEVIQKILGKESTKLDPEYLEKINWMIDYFSKNDVEFITVKKQRKRLHLFDPNKVVKTKFKIPKAPIKIEQTVIKFDQMTWQTILIESYNEQTIRGILDNIEIDNRYIISGYPGFFGQSTANNNL
ncbi:MAG: hypothetical protein ACXACR_16345 [Candidatus Hodarchaeales archaeon]|jgi:hypothetical protein